MTHQSRALGATCADTPEVVTGHGASRPNARSSTDVDLADVAPAIVAAHDCPTCEGSGVVPTHQNYWGKWEDTHCPRCSGTGRTYDHPLGEL